MAVFTVLNAASAHYLGHGEKKTKHFSCHISVKDMGERQNGLSNDQVLKIT